MRFLPLFITLLFFVSCGKDSTSSTSAGGNDNTGAAHRDDQAEAGVEDACTLDACNTITADGSSVDLLDSMIDSTAEISNSEITFTSSKVSVAEGDRISCRTEVRNGEAYQYSLVGDKLEVQTDNGSYSMNRLNEGGSGIKGTWVWRGTIDQGMFVIRTMSIIGNSRVILKTHCES